MPETRERFSVGLKKEVATEHFPITVADSLDTLLRPSGFKRLRPSDVSAHEFVWENKQGERATLHYYTKVDTLTRSMIFCKDKDLATIDITKELEMLYRKLNNAIYILSQRLGYPYLSTSRELLLEIGGDNPMDKAKDILPLVRKLYMREEGVQVCRETVLENTHLLIQIVFGLPE